MDIYLRQARFSIIQQVNSKLTGLHACYVSEQENARISFVPRDILENNKLYEREINILLNLKIFF